MASSSQTQGARCGKAHCSPLNLPFLLNRNGGLSSPHLKSQADLLVTIAKYWVKAAPEDIAVLATFAASLKIKSTGMVDKNRERLRQFNLPANKDALLHLPARVFAEAAKAKKGDKSEAVQVMLALAVELLIQSTLRLENLVAFLTQVGGVDVESLGLEHQLDALRSCAVILDQQYAHWLTTRRTQ